MKKIYQVLCTGLALILLTTACDTDVLDIKQRGVIGTDTYTVADDRGVEDMIAAIYSKVRGDGFNYFNMKTMGCYPSLV